MKYRIEYRSSWHEGPLRTQYVVQDTGGNFHEFEAADDADAQAQAHREWQAVIAMAEKVGLLSIGFVQLEHVPDPTPVVLQWKPLHSTLLL